MSSSSSSTLLVHPSELFAPWIPLGRQWPNLRLYTLHWEVVGDAPQDIEVDPTLPFHAGPLLSPFWLDLEATTGPFPPWKKNVVVPLRNPFQAADAAMECMALPEEWSYLVVVVGIGVHPQGHAPTVHELLEWDVFLLSNLSTRPTWRSYANASKTMRLRAKLSPEWCVLQSLRIDLTPWQRNTKSPLWKAYVEHQLRMHQSMLTSFRYGMHLVENRSLHLQTNRKRKKMGGDAISPTRGDL